MMFPTENKNGNILGTVNEFVATVNRQCDIAIRRISICPREVIGDDLKQMPLALSTLEQAKDGWNSVTATEATT